MPSFFLVEIGSGRSRSRILPIAAAALGVASIGCGPGYLDGRGDSSPGADYCAREDGAPPLGASEVEVGTGSGDAFDPLEDGDALPLEQGSQGGTMLVLTVRLTGVEDAPRACLELRLDNEIEGMDELPDSLNYIAFDRKGAVLEAAGVFDLLGYSPAPLIGQSLHLTTTVSDGATSVTSEVELELE